MTLTIESDRGQLYVVRNIGNEKLTGLTLISEHPITRDIPRGIELAPNQGHQFLMAGTMQVGLPTDVQFTWDGQDTPVFVPLPPK